MIVFVIKIEMLLHSAKFIFVTMCLYVTLSIAKLQENLILICQ